MRTNRAALYGSSSYVARDHGIKSSGASMPKSKTQWFTSFMFAKANLAWNGRCVNMNLKELASKGIKYLTDSDYRFLYNASKGLYDHMSDEKYLRLMYHARMGQNLNLENPQTFNEKLQWLKLYDRKPEYTTIVDKYAVKEYVAGIIGEEYIIPTLGVWDRFEDIDFATLPDKFVLKCTHDSASVIICHDKHKFDYEKAEKILTHCLSTDYYRLGREWAYKNVPRRIIAEKYMESSDRESLMDYKIFNFNGTPKIIQVDYDRFTNHKRNLYTTAWEYIEAEICYPTDPDHIIDKPRCLDKMLFLAKVLSADIPHVRSDFYCIDEKVYFGELTLYPESGMGLFKPEEFGLTMGEYITLPDRGGVLLVDGDTVLWVHSEADSHRCKMLSDYKFYCFNGEPTYCQVIANRFAEETIDFFDMEWVHQEFTGLSEPHKPFSPSSIPIPITFGLMKESARKLAEGIPFVRIDFYEVDGKMYFGEITFYPASGFGAFEPDKWNERIGEQIMIGLEQ